MSAGDDRSRADRIGEGGEMSLLIRLLEEIRDQQRSLLDHQREALSLQREHATFVRQQAERNERIQDRSERLQEMSARTIATARKALIVILPVIGCLLLYLTWILLR
jgi:ABC-type uncharacterized transport system involved in gliding motility auxiliary subunit